MAGSTQGERARLLTENKVGSIPTLSAKHERSETVSDTKCHHGRKSKTECSECWYERTVSLPKLNRIKKLAEAFKASRPTYEKLGKGRLPTKDGTPSVSCDEFQGAIQQWIGDIQAVEEVLASEDPTFNREQFARDCGIEEFE